MKVQQLSAIVYGWSKLGRFVFLTSLYEAEGLQSEVIVYSLLDEPEKYKKNKVIYNPDVVLFIDDRNMPEKSLANAVLLESISNICEYKRPFFSIFTPTFKTGDRIKRTYQSILSQTFEDWEWIIVDDSPDDDTWNLLENIKNSDHRVKIHKINPTSKGNIGLVKNRACCLCEGDWLVELDHDDELMPDCLNETHNAILKHPDSMFFYSDYAPILDDGAPITYDYITEGEFYGREDNTYCFGYAGNLKEIHHGKEYIRHYHCDINPLTVRFNIGMPNHARIWNRLFYLKIGGHNKMLSVSDDFELFLRTFLNTRVTHIKKMLYIQRNNHNSTVDNNFLDINMRCRIIRDHYEILIHKRIEELGFEDWCWDNSTNSGPKYQIHNNKKLYFEKENVLNYIHE
jgi:glycosyltransferase involved in cell wall biosynthesis